MEALSKNKVKFINSLKIKKYRSKNNAFVAEGEKIILDIIKSNAQLLTLLSSDISFLELAIFKGVEKFKISAQEMRKISSLKTVTSSLAIFQMPEKIEFRPTQNNSATIFCDGIQNPGNLGTIIRTADWFGIQNIVCSNKSADLYNPKTIQSTMGAITRVNISYQDSSTFFEHLQQENISSFGAFLYGETIYDIKFPKSAVLVIGNEGKGISKEVEKYITKKITIPKFGNKAESLNAAIAAGIIMSEYKRQF